MDDSTNIQLIIVIHKKRGVKTPLFYYKLWNFTWRLKLLANATIKKLRFYSLF